MTSSTPNKNNSSQMGHRSSSENSPGVETEVGIKQYWHGSSWSHKTHLHIHTIHSYTNLNTHSHTLYIYKLTYTLTYTLYIYKLTYTLTYTLYIYELTYALT